MLHCSSMGPLPCLLLSKRHAAGRGMLPGSLCRLPGPLYRAWRGPCCAVLWSQQMSWRLMEPEAGAHGAALARSGGWPDRPDCAAGRPKAAGWQHWQQRVQPAQRSGTAFIALLPCYKTRDERRDNCTKCKGIRRVAEVGRGSRV